MPCVTCTNDNFMPKRLYLNDTLVPAKDLPDVSYFATKIKKLMDDTLIDINI
jgi:hypothetical protein